MPKPRPTYRSKNEFIDCGDHYEIVLYDMATNEIGRSKIDKQDYEKVKDSKWCKSFMKKKNKNYTPHSYCYNDKAGLLHRFLLNPPRNMVVDHINHDGLDNRRANLRIVTNSENLSNNRAVGVWWDKVNKKWATEFKVRGTKIFVGRFKDRDVALKARAETKKRYSEI